MLAGARGRFDPRLRWCIPADPGTDRQLHSAFEVVEKWGKSLTAVVVVAGLVLAAIYFYGVWQTGAGIRDRQIAKPISH